MTPSHDPSRTPSHGDSAWDPSSAAILARSTDDFDYTGSYDTPSPAVIISCATYAYICSFVCTSISLLHRVTCVVCTCTSKDERLTTLSL